MSAASSADQSAGAIDLGGVVNVDLLRSWMDSHHLEAGSLSGFHRIGGGTQNVMVGFARGGRRFVLRRGPRHLRSSTNTVLAREIQILNALSHTSIPHPHLIASCDDDSIMYGSLFYLMEPIEGFNGANELPPLHRNDAQVRRQMGLEMADAAADLAGIDYHGVGLADLGRPDGFLERQVPRWLNELQSYRRYDNYPGPAFARIETVAGWLADNTPRIWQPGIMHGDFHVANVMFGLDGPQLVAVVDWEMCTIGDPLLDLGWLLATWPHRDQPGGLGDSALARAGNLASARELIERYAERSNRDVSAVRWYTVLACFKLGVLLEGTYARACAGSADPGVGEHLHRLAQQLIARASMLVDGDDLL